MREASSHSEDSGFSPPRRAAWLDKFDVLIFLFGTTLIVCAASYTIHRDYLTTLNLWRSELSAAVIHRSWTLRSALRQSQDDAGLLAEFTPTQDLLAPQRNGSKPTLPPTVIQSQVMDLFDDFQRVYEYATLYLYDDAKRVVVRAGTSANSSDGVTQIAEFKQTLEATIKNGHYTVKLVRDPQRGLSLVFVMPAFAHRGKGAAQGASPVGAVALVDPFAKELLPLLKTRTPVTRTGELALLQVQNGDASYASRGYESSGLLDPFSTSDTLRKSAVAAVDDRASFGQYIDYRGIEVVAAMQRVADIDSVIVYKVDKDEAFADYRRTVRIEISATIAIVLAYAGLILVFRGNAVAREMRILMAQKQLVNETLESTVSQRTSQLALMNQQLSIELRERERAEKEVRELNTELEERVRNRTIELEATNRELTAFAYSVSHDLRAPLRGIDGWSLALLEDYGSKLDSAGQQYLTRVRSETQRMGNLIDDMLLLSRLARDEMHMNAVDLSAIAQRITVGLRDAHPLRSMEFNIEPNLVINGDQRLIEIALTNLLSNAVKFTSKTSEALIEFGKVEREVETAFYIRDNGAGFDMKYAHVLFGAFQRLHKDSEFPGTGIGLAIVQRVIARHGGRVWAEAGVNRGATFWFTVGVRHECP